MVWFAVLARQKSRVCGDFGAEQETRMLVVDCISPVLPYPSSVSRLSKSHPTNMEKPKITAYLKTYCGWSEGVRAIMRKYDLPFEEKDIIANPAFRWEMEQRSGQPLSPCVEINGTMLPDISGEEVER